MFDTGQPQKVPCVCARGICPGTPKSGQPCLPLVSVQKAERVLDTGGFLERNAVASGSFVLQRLPFLNSEHIC